MATEAQIEANRINAQKSTGPRTPEGRAIVSRNAITHGLLARAGVLPGEDEHEFAAHREGLLQQLRPGSPLEEVLAERAVDLSWRLQRAARDQEVAYAALYQKYLEGQPEPQEPDTRHAALGRMIVEDFCGPAVLERLQRYERRIESGFYKALNELRQAADQRQEAALEALLTPAPWEKEDGQAQPGVPNKANFGRRTRPPGVFSCQRSGPRTDWPDAEEQRRQTKPISQGVSPGKSEVWGTEPALAASDLTIPASPEAPCGVTTNVPDHGQGESPDAK